jgi:hypothetical protein
MPPRQHGVKRRNRGKRRVRNLAQQDRLERLAFLGTEIGVAISLEFPFHEKETIESCLPFLRRASCRRLCDRQKGKTLEESGWLIEQREARDPEILDCLQVALPRERLPPRFDARLPEIFRGRDACRAMEQKTDRKGRSQDLHG